jgi:hypothetical protein
MFFLADKASASLQRIRRWAELSAAYSNGDHFAVSGQDALSALAGRASEKADRMLPLVNGRSLYELDVG